eukprot:CAMPEP_0201922054 /NCGR_PEP_ID=MMETSP0903-20130614/10208_1 /ASSEMBLY_ACC=CAM_ASM_000552 /TAXON_ID=420261 /ORGANISM="Thalassiosira antarctica, Strain CCMP982" /LENGTH=637 /DNA_ID=CAMNT_0048459127 /DNA_START=13 /DNA_END=1926 /DNA_ORIENTATION=+
MTAIDRTNGGRAGHSNQSPVTNSMVQSAGRLMASHQHQHTTAHSTVVPFMHIVVLLLALLTTASPHVWHPGTFFSLHHPSFVPSSSASRLQSWSTSSQRRPQLNPGTALCSSPDNNQADPAWGLSVGIVGAGPSGLLLAHSLVQSQLPIDKIDVYESRSDPRDIQKQKLAGRAYALGLGVRGRTAIRSVDETLWSAVKKRGSECERFRLHLTSKFNVKLRDREDGVEPSVLIYQTDLCAALLDELDRRANANSESLANIVTFHFDSNITHVDLASSAISVKEGNEDTQKGPYDLIVGTDGANSIVRHAIQTYSPPDTFSFTQRRLLPGCFKVARIEKMPPLLDPDSVGLILPETKSLGITTFVEPTVEGGACILFAGRLPSSDEASATDTDGEEMDLGSILFPHPDSKEESGSQSDIETIKKLIVDQFPLLEGTSGMEDMVQQLLFQRTSVADSIKCNIYNSNSDVTATAICGDAAHATGGVSGQGCNSALMDSVALVDCLLSIYQPTNVSTDTVKTTKRAMLHQSVSSYSQKAVPQGHALYDLSFGNDGKTLPIFRNIRAISSNAIDAIFGGRFGIGKKPLQTLLASSLSSFVDIRRDREKYFVEDFPSDQLLREELGQVYRQGIEEGYGVSKHLN